MLMKKLLLAFERRSVHRTPEAAAKKYHGRSFIQVRGNVYARLNGTLSDHEHQSYIDAARHADDLDQIIK